MDLVSISCAEKTRFEENKECIINTSYRKELQLLVNSGEEAKK